MFDFYSILEKHNWQKGLSDLTFPLEDTDKVGILLNYFLCTRYSPKNNYFEFEEMWIKD